MSTQPTLEQRIAALEQLVGKPLDTLTPTYLTVTPDGKVGADFTGTVDALGVILPSGSSSLIPPPVGINNIVWRRQSDNAVVADLVCNSVGGEESLTLLSQPQSGDTAGVVGLMALTPAGTHFALLEAVARAALGGATVGFQVEDDSGGSVGGTIMGSDGTSSFLQLSGAAQPLELAWGSAQVHFAAQSTVNAVINHNIGRVPQVLLGITNAAGFEVSGVPGATDNTWTVFTGAAVTANVTFYWVAIG